jgi:hypothetical protein
MIDRSEESIRPRVAIDPGKPSKEEVALHNATHVQYRSWCPHCVKGRGQSSPHYAKTQATEDEQRVPTIVMDYFFQGEDNNPTATMVAIKDSKSRAMHAFLVEKKGTVDFKIVKKIAQWIDALGYKRVVIKSDQEPSIRNLQEELRKECITEMVPENSPKGESKSNGLIENAIKSLEGMIRTIKDYIETKMQEKLEKDSPMFAWIIEAVGTLITRYRTGEDGKTPYQRLKGKKPSNVLVPLGEKVLYLPLKQPGRMNKLAPKFKYGIYVGVNPRTSESLVSNEHGTFRARTVRRLADDMKWDIAMMRGIQGMPWDLATTDKVFAEMTERSASAMDALDATQSAATALRSTTATPAVQESKRCSIRAQRGPTGLRKGGRRQIPLWLRQGRYTWSAIRLRREYGF